MPKVDDIYVQVGVDLPKLDQGMRAGERRVDQAANRMGQSIRRAEDRIARGPGGMIAASNSRLFGVIGAGAAIGAAGRAASATLDSGGDWIDFLDSLAKGIPIFNSWYETGNKLFNRLNRAEQELNDWAAGMQARFEGTAGLNNARNQIISGTESALAFGDPAAEAEAARQKAIRDLEEDIRQFNQVVAEQIENPKAKEQWKKRIEEYEQAQRGMIEKRFDKAIADSEGAKVRFDTVGTVFGAFRVNRPDRDAMRDKQQKSIDETAKNTEAIANAMAEVRRILANVIPAFRPFS